jgi:hypothetical protein
MLERATVSAKHQNPRRTGQATAMGISIQYFI